MDHDFRWAHLDDVDGASRPPMAPGRRTLTMSLAERRGNSTAVQQRASDAAQPSRAPDDRACERGLIDAAFRPDLNAAPVQRKAVVIGGHGEPERGGADRVHRAAADGISGAGGALPHQSSIQEAFGRHSVAHVQAHTDGAAAAGARAMGAEAFATGHHVAFAGAPSLHTAAHEAAHVVQQAAGVHLAGGVGEAGDVYERHADAVADRVVRGESAEALLDEVTGGGRAGGAAAVQHKLIPGAETPVQNLNVLVQMLNTLCYGAYRFGVAGDGSISIAQGNFDLLRTLPPALAAKVDRFGNALAAVLLADEPVTIDFVAGSKFIIGNFKGEAIDLGDIQTVVGASRDDSDDPVDVYGTLAHEITEQYFKQAQGKGYDEAHGAASELEFEITGWRRISETMIESTEHQDSTYSGVSELVYQREKPPNDRRTIHMTIGHNKITSLQTAPEVDFLSLLGPMSAPQPKKSPEKKKVERKENTSGKSTVQQFLDDLEDEEFDMFAPDKPKDPPPDQGDGMGGSGIVQQQAVQMVTGAIQGEDEYRTLFCLANGWNPDSSPLFEIDDTVRADAQRYADQIIDAAYHEAERQLQRAINGAHYAFGKLTGLPDTKTELIHANLKKAVPSVAEFDGDALAEVVATLEDMYKILQACTFDALNYKPASSTHTIAFALPGVPVVHLLEPFYTYQKDARARGLTLVHECAHIVNADINHGNDEVWFLNAYNWERIANILDQLAAFFLKETQEGRM